MLRAPATGKSGQARAGGISSPLSHEQTRAHQKNRRKADRRTGGLFPGGPARAPKPRTNRARPKTNTTPADSKPPIWPADNPNRRRKYRPPLPRSKNSARASSAPPNRWMLGPTWNWNLTAKRRLTSSAPGRAGRKCCTKTGSAGDYTAIAVGGTAHGPEAGRCL